MHYDLGYFDDETWRLEPIDNPFGSKCYLCPRNELLPVRPEWTVGSWCAWQESNLRPSD
jgi:hypothetical protein